MSEQGMSQSVAPAGWFADPSGRLRWWDGQVWTEHTAAGYPTPYPAECPTPLVGSQPGVNALAILALIGGFIPQLGVVGLPLGLVALRQMRASRQKGRIPAIIGITFGSLWSLGIVLAMLTAGARHA